MKLLPITTALAAALLLAAAPVARAQMSSDAIAQSFIGNTNAIVGAAVANANLRNILATDREAGIDPNTGKAGLRRPAGASLAYAPTATLKASTVQGYVDRLKAKNPAAAQAVAASLGPGKNDYGQIYHGILQGTGLHDNNAADNLAAYMVLGWMIVNNVQQASGLPAGSPQGVSRQLAPRLAADAQLTAPGVPARLGEEMKLLFVVVQGGWQSALKEGKLPAYQQGVAAMFKNQYGLDMSQVKPTAQGFAKK